MLIQLFYGALMAGSKAAVAAPTWPAINGYIIPPEIYSTPSGPGIRHLLTIQFVHRMLAYTIGLLVLILYKKSSFLKMHKAAAALRNTMLLLVCLQIFLGITTLLNSITPLYPIYAILHQGMGILLSMSILLVFYLSHRKL